LGVLFAGKISNPRDLKEFLRRTQNEFRLRIKKIRSDNGTEFKNSQIEGFLEEEGIKHEFSSPYTPQQNGVVERKNRTLLDMARTMLDKYKTPDRFCTITPGFRGHQDPGTNIITRCAGTKSHTYDESWYRNECHTFTI
jgi:transposase InsO family protein